MIKTQRSKRERERVVIEKNNQYAMECNERLKAEEEGGKESVICKDCVGYKYSKCISTRSKYINGIV